MGSHKDTGDVKDGWAVMYTWGRFEGKETVEPELEVQLRVQEGDAIFLRSAILEHFVAPFAAESAATVFFTKGMFQVSIFDGDKRKITGFTFRMLLYGFLVRECEQGVGRGR